MANRHVKTINGKKYYYQSVRKGKKVTSIYLGPVEKVDKAEELKESQVSEEVSKVNEESAETENKEKEETRDEDLEMPDDHYIA
jgi:hypothetical protein